jgi:hypothetical protein
LVRNNGQRDKYYIWGSSRILDNLSNEVMISRASIGSKNRNMNRHSSLSNDIPLGGDILVNLHFDGVNPEVNKIKALEIDSRGSIGVVTFNDVTLSN